jgi:hypothetical protein
MFFVNGWLFRLPAPLSNWTQSREFPVIASRTFSEEMRDREEGSGDE